MSLQIAAAPQADLDSTFAKVRLWASLSD